MILVSVRWADATRTAGRFSWEELPGLAVLDTAGYLVRSGPDAITLATDWCTEEMEWRDVYVIPRACIISTIEWMPSEHSAKMGAFRFVEGEGENEKTSEVPGVPAGDRVSADRAQDSGGAGKDDAGGRRERKGK